MQGCWFLNFHCFTNYVKVGFFRRADLVQMPPLGSKQPDICYLHILEDAAFEEPPLADWVKQAIRLPGEKPQSHTDHNPSSLRALHCNLRWHRRFSVQDSRVGCGMRLGLVLMAIVLAMPATAQVKLAKDERIWTCETSIAGEKTEVNYVRDAEFSENVGSVEKSFSGWGKISCPGYVTLREILRRNAMADDGSYCLLWDQGGDTYIGAQTGPRKGNALCRKTFCEKVNGARAATFRNANALAVAGYDAVTQRPGAAILAATSGSVVGTFEAASAAAMGVAVSPVAVGSMVIGTAAAGGTMWYCAEG